MILLNCGAGEDSESPLDCKETKPVNPKENQPWICIVRTHTEIPIVWPPNAKNQLIGKDPDSGKDWGQEEKGVTEDEMFGWHHWLNGHELKQAQEYSEGQGSLACCNSWKSWGCKELDMTERLNNNSCLGPSPAFHSSVCESPQVISWFLSFPLLYSSWSPL